MDNLQYKWKNIKKLALGIVAFEGTEHLYNIISELRDVVDYVTIGLLEVSYHGDKIPLNDLKEIYRLHDEDRIVDNIINIELDINKSPREQETDKRNLIILNAEDNRCTHIIVIDSDEFYTKKSFIQALLIIDENNYEMTYCLYINYYHDYNHYLVYPFKDGMYVPFVSKVKYRHKFECTDFLLPSDPTRRYVRPFNGVKNVIDKNGKSKLIKQYTVDYFIFPWNIVKMHHLSWIRADIRKKLNMWSSKKCFKNYNDLIDKAVNTFNNFDENSITSSALMLFNTPGNKVDVKKFPKLYIHPLIDYKTRVLPCKEYKKIIILNLLSNNSDVNLFQKLEKTCRNTWAKDVIENKYDNISYWSVIETNKESYLDIDNKIIYIHFDNNNINILQLLPKFTLSIELLEKAGYTYDYIIRTNTSTWINIPLINEFLANENDETHIYTSKYYAAYWSCFNMYMIGNCIIMHKRNFDILNEYIKKMKPVAIADDVLISSIFTIRCNKLGLNPYDYMKSLEGINLLDDYDKTDFNNIDFSVPIYQIKTYNYSENLINKFNETPHNIREIHDIFKMEKINLLWHQYYDKNNNIEDLLSNLYNKIKNPYIRIINMSASEWKNASFNEKYNIQFKNEIKLEDAKEYLNKKSKQYAIKK